MDFLYKTTVSGIEITGYTGPGGSVVIPEQISGKTVYSISSESFLNKTTISSISLPSGIITIGDKAFSFCTGLTSISFGNNIQTIGKSAFENCYNLTSIVLPNSVTNIGDLAFYKCSGLVSADIGSGVLNNGLGYGIFYYCTKLENITIPNSITRIPKYMFYQCTSLSVLPVSSYVQTIEDYAFRYCNSFVDITLPNSVTSLGDYSFSDCGNLEKIVFGNGISIVPSNVCSFCNKLKDITIPSTVTDIEKEAFGWCGLEFISFPDSVTSIGEGICKKCDRLEEVVIGNGIQTIPSDAFYDCKSLLKITFGDNVSNIEYTPFYNCINLTNLTFNGNAPEVETSNSLHAFNGVPGPTYYYDGTTGWANTWFGMRTICIDCASSSSSMGSSGGSSESSSESSRGSSQSYNNSSTSESSEIQARTLPFSIRGISWKSSGTVNGHLSAVSSTYQNRISQTVEILLDQFRIDRVALYLGKRRGLDTSYSIWIDIYEADFEGKPLNLLESISKNAIDCSSEGWYFFDAASITRPAPAEGMICIVFRQDGGDDLNCIPWFYSSNSDATIENKSVCYISSDSISWNQVDGISMTMKLINSVDMFSEAYSDTPPHRINTAPGDFATITLDTEDYLATGLSESKNIKLVPNEQEDTSGTSDSNENEDSLKRPYVEINPPKIITSLILDGSGSMGWNDRRFGRLEIAKEISNLLLDEYPGEAVLDIIRMGAIQVEEIDFAPSKRYGSIKIDLNNPESVLENADGSQPEITDGIVAYGFDNLEKTHTYVISRIFSDEIELEDGEGIIDQDLQIRTPLNVSSFGDAIQNALFEIDDEGPGSESGNGTDAMVVTLVGDVNQIRRNIQVKRPLFVSQLAQEAEKGDFSIEVNSSTDFKERQNIDIIDANGTDPQNAIDSIDINTISLNEELLLDFGENSSVLKGFIQESIVGKYVNLSLNTTLEMLVKDSGASRPVGFYLETSKGGRLKWSFSAFKEWNPLLLFYSDKGGKISVNGFDTENKPLPDGTEVQFYVDNPNSDFEIDINEPIVFDIINTPLEEDEDVIYLETISGIKAGDSATLLGEDQENERITGFLIDSVDEEKKSIVIFPPYTSSVFEIVKIEISQSDSEKKEEKERVFLPISAVNLTPSRLGREADPLTLVNYDAPPTSSLITDLDTLNQNPDYETKLPTDFPSMWNPASESSIVSLRILPITDDVVDTEKDKENKVVAATKKTLSDQEKALIESLEEDYRIEMENAGTPLEEVSIENSELFNVSIQKTPEDADYSIQTPILLFGGQGESFMHTFSKEMEMLEENVAGSHTESYGTYGGTENWEQSGLLARKYEIFPYVILKDTFGNAIAIKEVESFDVYFASPYQIWSNIGPSDKKVDFACIFKNQGAIPGEPSESEGTVEIPGCYASTNEIITIDYIVTQKGVLVKEGNLLVRIFDGTRNSDQIKTPEAVVPDFSEELCSVSEDGTPSFDLATARASIYSRRPRGTEGTYLDEVEYQPAIYLEEYIETVTVPIVNGRASISIKAPESIVAKIIAMAEYVFPEDQNQSITKQDPIWFINPLEVVYKGATSFVSGHSQPLYEIGAEVYFKGVLVPDNVPVEFKSNRHSRFLPGQGNVISRDNPMAQGITNFIDGVGQIANNDIQGAVSDLESKFAKYGDWPPTPISPAISKTINGIARGVYLGTHGDVVNHFDSQTLEQKGDEETLTISTSYNGFFIELNQKIEWTGIDENNDFKFRLKMFNDQGVEIPGFAASVYADGWSSIYVLADLAASVTSYPSCDPYIDVLLGKDIYGNKIGDGQPSRVIFSGAGDGVWQEDQPLLSGKLIGASITLEGEKGRGYCLSKPISLSALIEKEKCDCTYMDACFPQGSLIDAWTVAKVGTQKFNGTGCMCEKDWNNDCENLVPCGDSFVTKNTRPATVLWTEPLAGKIETFGYESFIVNRDGNNTEVIVDVTFSGEAIPIVAERNNATDASGNRPAIPIVSFDIYKLVIEKDPNGSVIRTTEVRNETLTLKNYSSPCIIELTTLFIGNETSHFHKCQVDKNGDGETTGEYVDGEEILATHTHKISSYVVLDAINTSDESHSHNLRSIAKTIINPTNDIVNQICLVAKFSYDASKKPIDRTVSVKACDAGGEAENGWSLVVKAPNEYSVQESTTVDDEGMDLIAELQHTVNGELVEIPEGTRVHIEVCAYLQDDSEVPGTTRKTIVFAKDEKRPFVLLVWKASVDVGNGEIVEAEAKTKVNSSFSWLPNIRAMVPEITSDRVFINNALSSITTIGGSPLYDATYFASSRIISYKNENETWRDAFSCIALITDGDENLSDKVLDQGIKAIKRTGENIESNTAAIAMGKPHPADLLILKKYAGETSGIVIRAAEKTVSGQDIAKKVFTEGLEEANMGTYKNIVDLSSKKIFNSTTINAYFPTDSSITFKARFGMDGKNWGEWSQKIDVPPSGFIDLKTLTNTPYRFMEYETVLIGNSNFESPRLLSISVSYIEPKKHTILFAPISVDINSEEYVGEVLITHKVSNSENSTIQYGIVQADTLEEIEYFNDAQPLFGTATRQILLGRHNELAISTDRSKFWLVNGPWPKVTGIEVYKLVGGIAELIDPSLYSSNPGEGSISFSTIQGEDVKLSVSLKYPPLINIVCLITNYGEESVSIDHIGVIYNTVQRIDKNELGIIRTPISDVYEMSSSSSESSQDN